MSAALVDTETGEVIEPDPDAIRGVVTKWAPDARREKVALLHEAGMTQQAIADVLGVSVGTVNADLFNSEKVAHGVGRPRKADPEPALTPPTPIRKNLEQAHAEADVVNAFRSLVKQTFTPENLQSMTPKARKLLADALRDALNTIEKETETC